MNFLAKKLAKIEDSRTGFVFWLISFLCLIGMRLLVESWLVDFKNRAGLFFFYEFTHTFLFFFISYLLFLGLFRICLKVSLQKASNILLFGFLMILTPPLIDALISGGAGFWSFYDFGGLRYLGKFFLSFFDNTPEIGITYGVRMEVFLALLFMFFYSFLKILNEKDYKFPFLKLELFLLKLKISNSRIFLFVKAAFFSLLITFIAYVIFFVLGTFPSWITIAVEGFSKGFLAVGEIDIVQMFLTPAKIFAREIPEIVSSLNIKMSLVYALIATALVLAGFFFYCKTKFLAFAKNTRLPQLLYHGGLLLIGTALGMIFAGGKTELNFFNAVAFLVMLIAVFSAWLASVIVNDFQDKAIDQKTNPDRPLIRSVFSPAEYGTIGGVFFAVSLLFSALVSFKAVFFLAAYQAIAWLYSAWPLRLKRFAFVSTFVSAIASLMILFAGYVMASPNQNINGLPFRIIFLLIVSYTFSLPLKDFKDMEGDREDDVKTLPVLFGEQWGKIIIGGGIFLSYLLSVIFLNEFRLFWWALLCGGASFWIVNIMDAGKRVNPRNIFWWIMGVLITYLFILIKIIFW